MKLTEYITRLTNLNTAGEMLRRERGTLMSEFIKSIDLMPGDILDIKVVHNDRIPSGVYLLHRTDLSFCGNFLIMDLEARDGGYHTHQVPVEKLEERITLIRRKTQPTNEQMLTEKQKEIIETFYQTSTTEECAIMANVSVPSVRKYAKAMELESKIPDRYRKRWTTEELNFLMGTMNMLTLEEKAEKLGRSVHSVRIMISKLGLGDKNGRPEINLPPEDIQWLTDNYPFRKNKEIAERLGIKVSTLLLLARRYGLSKWSKNKPIIQEKV